MPLRFTLFLALLIAFAVWLAHSRQPVTQPVASRQPKLPVYFIANQGQLPPQVSYYVHGRQTAAYFTPNTVWYSFSDSQPIRPASLSPSVPSPRTWVRLEFLDANPNPLVSPFDRTGAIVSYFHGSPEQWKVGIPTYAGVRYTDLWPGVQLEFTGPTGLLKYTFQVNPGADPKQIRFAYRGATSVSLSPSGSLRVDTPSGGFTDEKPVAWQDTPRGRQPVAAAFRLHGEEVQFELGAYDPSLPLTVDPVVLTFAGYLGGSSTDEARAVAIDPAGNTYVTGTTSSTQTTFPVTAGPDLTHNNNKDAFVAKINAAGTALIYAGYIGGSVDDMGYGIAVDAAGNAYVAGGTRSTETTFPVINGPDLTQNGSSDAFVAKVNAAGTALIYSGYVGGGGFEEASAIAIDGAGNAYITGRTDSTQASFPVLVGPDLTFNGSSDVFVTKINAAGTALLYSGFIGGSGFENGSGIAVDVSGSAYITGHTQSSEATFPVLVGPDLTHNGSSDAFVAKVNASGSALLYSGYIGGSVIDEGRAITVDGAGNAYVTGFTESTQATFPVLVGPDLTYNGSYDAFVAKVITSGASLAYSGYIGGSGRDEGHAIAVDPAGNAYIAGWTLSTQTSFPVLEGPDLTQNGSSDAFISKLNAAGSSLIYSGFLGGSSSDEAYGIAVDPIGAAYLAGSTFSTQATFPVTVGPDLTSNGSGDAFAAKIAPFPSTAGPMAALRNGFNAIETNTFPFTGLRNAGGNFRLNPVIALTPAGRAFLLGRDSSAGLWINFLKPDDTFQGWIFAGGNSPTQPALTAAGETAWIALRDPWSSYWVRSYNPISGFTPWTWLQGIFVTHPQIAACSNGDVYIAGRDNFNGLWTRRYSAAATAWQAWRFQGGITTGVPAVACGADNAAYLAVRDPGFNMWLVRVFQETAPTWNYGGGILQHDLQIAVQGNLLHVVGLSFNSLVYRTWQVGSGWQTWVNRGGVLDHFAAATYGPHLFVAAQDLSGNLWWWTSLGNSWFNFGNKNVAVGSRFSTGPR
jgi:hypothetical protein